MLEEKETKLRDNRTKRDITLLHYYVSRYFFLQTQEKTYVMKVYVF